jgi:uncharacterized protein
LVSSSVCRRRGLGQNREEHAIPLDPRSPFVFDIRELGRRPGAMRRVHRETDLVEDLGTDVIGIPRGSRLELDLRFESVFEGILVSGTVRGSAAGECVRCLGEVRLAVDADLQELFAYPDRVVDGDEEDDVRALEGDNVDLGPAVLDAVVLALPFQPVCREDCPGLCSECGARLADDPEHHHEVTDPRWAALQGLLASDDGPDPAAGSQTGASTRAVPDGPG